MSHELDQAASPRDRARVMGILLDRIWDADLALVGLEIADGTELENLFEGRGRLREIIDAVLRDLGRKEQGAPAVDLGPFGTLGQLADRLAYGA